jgi:hypothetical protein
VNERERIQIGKIISLSSATCRAAQRLALQGIETQFVRNGRQGSGLMATAVVQAMGRSADLFVSELVSKVAPVSRSQAAFSEIEVAIRQFMRSCDDDLQELHRTNQALRLQGRSLFIEIGRRELAKVADTVERRLDIERYDFNSQIPEAPKTARLVSKGGRPPAEFWDDLWAHIAASLYAGELKPKSQADVQRSMSEWIEGRGYSAADSTVKGRARRIWDLIDALDE